MGMTMLLLVLFQTCAAMFITVETLIPILTLKKTSAANELMLENHRTRTKQNYMSQRDLDNDMDLSDNSITYSDPLDLTTSEELPALIVDYANMIRNDIILLDDSVETRTRKRGNMKVRRHQEVKMDVQCTCEEEDRGPRKLGDDYVPSFIETRNCNFSSCLKPYSCQPRYHNVTVLKRKKYFEEKSQEKLPRELATHWVTVKQAVTIGCFCIKDLDNDS